MNQAIQHFEQGYPENYPPRNPDAVPQDQYPPYHASTGSTPPPQSQPYGMPSASQTAGERRFESIHVYGGRAALCFDADDTKNNFPTVAIDGAIASAPRNYDWTNKIRIQLTKQELPVVAAVLIGVLPQCAFKSHGPQKDKGFEIVRQEGGKVYIKVFGGNGKGVRGVPVLPGDLFHVTSLVLRQLSTSMDGASINDVIALLWATQALR